MREGRWNAAFHTASRRVRAVFWVLASRRRDLPSGALLLPKTMSRSLRVGGVAIGLIGSLFLLASCADQRATSPRAASASIVPMGGGPVIASAQLPDVRFSEIHYDNTGTDAGEAIEISGPAGTDVSGWKLVLYNGNGGVPYGTPTTLSGTISNMCGGRGVIATLYPSNGIQNGGTTASPEADGMALVDATGAVVEFLSYEGVMTATSGPAAASASWRRCARSTATSATTTPVTSSLSAVVSRNEPSVVVRFQRRARRPSHQSVAAAKANRSAAGISKSGPARTSPMMMGASTMRAHVPAAMKRAAIGPRALVVRVLTRAGS